MDDPTISQILNVFDKSTLTPYFSDEKTKRIGEIIEVIEEKKIHVFSSLNSGQKFYFYTKQYAFAGVNLVPLRNIESIVSTSMSISPTGATTVNCNYFFYTCY